MIKALRKFRSQIVIRILFISALMFLFLYLLLQTTLYVTIVFIALLIIYQIVNLIRFAEHTNRRLTQFLQSIRHADFSQSFKTSGMGASFTELNKAFSDVISDFQRVREEKEEHHRYLQTVVQHVGIALLVYQKDGQVELINTAAKKLFRLTQLRRIKNLEKVSPALVKTLTQLKAGERSLIKIFQNGEILQLAIYATEFRLHNQLYTLASIHNIQSELEEREMEAWQKLIRVLTHEIMNSVTPISSLAATASSLLNEVSPDLTRDAEASENLKDISEAVRTIQKRSEGLLHFVEAYRSLTRLPQPKFKTFPLSDLFRRLRQLHEESIKKVNVNFISETKPPELQLTADPEQIEQVLINLVKNAFEAVQDQANAEIILKGFMDSQGRVVIQVIDNGPGIPTEIQEKIFIPFFTTKKEGSGIGLSLSRQIIRLHKGTISLSSNVKSGSIFTIRI
ncbi:MAG: GHKL domain-containing protein [bacterium]|nr:MAG: GHKL domain-containing protein [bacterium]